MQTWKALHQCRNCLIFTAHLHKNLVDRLGITHNQCPQDISIFENCLLLTTNARKKMSTPLLVSANLCPRKMSASFQMRAINDCSFWKLLTWMPMSFQHLQLSFVSATDTVCTSHNGLLDGKASLKFHMKYRRSDISWVARLPPSHPEVLTFLADSRSN